jgi:cytidylate kinase
MVRDRLTSSPAVIAVDGPAGAGKGTLSKRLAAHFGFAHLDTGLLYRAIGLRALKAGIALHGDAGSIAALARGITTADLASGDLRTDAVAQAASRVAAIPAVREALLQFQRDFAACPPGGSPGAVLDGRDIGTVVWPAAQYKLFVTARPDVRAARRVKELRERGLKAIQAVVLRDMQERDERDSRRHVAPLVPAPDAFVIDTSDLEPEAVLAAVLAFIRPVGNMSR